jgi:hypothetical protein
MPGQARHDGNVWEASTGYPHIFTAATVPCMTNRRSKATGGGGVWRWSGSACVAASISFLIGALATLDVLWSLLSPLMPLGFLCWMAALVITLYRRKWWWAVASLPAMGISLSIFAVIAAACARGNCLQLMSASGYVPPSASCDHNLAARRFNRLSPNGCSRLPLHHFVDGFQLRQHRCDPVQGEHDRAVGGGVVGVLVGFGEDGRDAGCDRTAGEERRIFALAARR